LNFSILDNERLIYGLELNVSFFSFNANWLGVIRGLTRTSTFAPALDGAVGRGVCIHYLGWDRDGSASISQRSIHHKRIINEVCDTSGKRWRRRHFGRNLRRECREGRWHPTVVPPLSKTLAFVAVLPAAATETFATIDSTSDLVHFYIESPINAIRMRASRAVGAGARGSYEAAEAADSAGKEHG
jgi:hypothetical protein